MPGLLVSIRVKEKEASGQQTGKEITEAELPPPPNSGLIYLLALLAMCASFFVCTASF